MVNKTGKLLLLVSHMSDSYQNLLGAAMKALLHALLGSQWLFDALDVAPIYIPITTYNSIYVFCSQLLIPKMEAAK